MKSLIKFIILLIISTSFNSCESDDGIDEPSNNQTITEFSYSVSDLNTSLENFVIKLQELQSANFSTMSIEDVNTIMDEYIFTGEQFVNAMKNIEEIKQKNKNFALKKKIDGPTCSAVDYIPGLDTGLSAGFMKAVGDNIKDTEEEVATINQNAKDGNITPNQEMEQKHDLAKKSLTKLATIGLGTGFGAGAAYVTAAVVGTATLPATATVIVTGAIVGSLVTWYSYSYATEQNKGTSSKHILLTGKTTVGGKLPVHLFRNNSTVVISVKGYAPVTLNNFDLPKSGMNKIIDIDGVKLQDAKFGGSTMVCLSEEKMTASSCEEVAFVTAIPYPPDPAPGKGVTVTATLIPSFPNCNITFSIVGSDGYSNSSTKPSNANGEASFGIPGGAKEVVDVVTITSSNGKKYTVTYVF